jgi:hypothetical protein
MVGALVVLLVLSVALNAFAFGWLNGHNKAVEAMTADATGGVIPQDEDEETDETDGSPPNVVGFKQGE